MTIERRTMVQEAPWPIELEEAVKELRYLEGWKFTLTLEERGQRCSGLTFTIYPNKPDAYHPERHVNTRFLYPVPAAAYNRDSWEEWLWERIKETEDHERAEWFRFVTFEGVVPEEDEVRRPFKPIHADGWDPGFIRKVVSEELADVPNAGRIVYFPCMLCTHDHAGRMGEKFTIKDDQGCTQAECGCGIDF